MFFQFFDELRAAKVPVTLKEYLALMDALAIPRAVLAGYDWGGRAACVVAALWPERCAGLARDRRAVCRLLWQTWSPTWRFDDATFERSAAAFDNPDFVDVVIHSYRHRFGLVPGDPAVADIERRLAAQPPITVPVLTFDGADDGVRPPASAAEHSHRFSGPRTHTVVPGVGHNMPQEVPQVFAAAVLSLVAAARCRRATAPT